MALCRFAIFPKSPTSFFPNCPLNSPEFMHLPLLLQNHKPTHRVSSSALHSSSSSMESAPEGYRRNVGVCLINPSKKVSAFLCGYVCVHVFLFVFLCFSVCMFICLYWAGGIFFFGQIFAASRLDIPNAWQMPQVLFFFFFLLFLNELF